MHCVINQAMVELLAIFIGQNLPGTIKRARFRGCCAGNTGMSNPCGSAFGWP
jgi:hypothetical protein